VRIERREIESASELTTMVTEVLEEKIGGFRVLDRVDFSGEGGIEVGLLAGDSEKRIFVVMAKDRSGDSLIMSYGRHLEWVKQNRDRMSGEHPQFAWDKEPGIMMLAESFSPHVLTLTSMLGAFPKMCYSIICLGMGTEKGLLVEPVEIPVARGAAAPVGAPAAPLTEVDLLTRAVSGIVGIADDLSISASLGYVSESLDWVPVANLRSRRGSIWIESGPGKWTTKRIDDNESLGKAMEKVKESYDEVTKTKGEANKNVGDDELSEAERKSLRWE
jgi:hypothetical protein